MIQKITMIQDMNINELVDLANMAHGYREVYAHFGITYDLLANTIGAMMFCDAIKHVKKDVKLNN